MSVVDEATATNPIAEYFQRLVDKANEPASVYDQRQKAICKRIPALKKEWGTIEHARQEHVRFRDQAKSKGLDTAPLDAEIGRHAEMLKALDDELLALEKEYVSPRPADGSQFDTRLKAAQALSSQQLGNSVILPTRDAALRALGQRVASIDVDNQGRAAAVQTTFGLGVPVKAAQPRYAYGIRPKALQWLPHLPFEQRPEDEGVKGTQADSFVHRLRASHVILVEEGHALVCDTLPSIETGRYNHREDRREREIPGGEGILTTDAYIKKLVGDVAAQGIDLDAETQPSVFHAALRECVLANTTAEPLFPATDARPVSDDIYNQIKMDWSRLATAPWSGDISGHWAKLKYTLENGERVRFWQKDHQDHYGFRVRTRDHTWIAGKVFIDTQRALPEGVLPIEFVEANGYSRSVARIGRMYIVASEDED